MSAHPHEPLQAGTEISTHKVIRKIGQGGFGIVYEVEHAYLGRRAMKEFFCSGLASRVQGQIVVNLERDKPLVDKLRRRFIENAKVLARLDHPAILKVHHIEERSGTAYMFTDIVDGVTLRDYLRQGAGYLEAASLRPLFEGVLDALAYCHSQGVLHRDIAPDNIMIRSAAKTPVLIDFGAVKQSMREGHGGFESSTIAVAKDRYAPPEQRVFPSPHAHGPYTDIFALGATLYHSLTGDPPADAIARMAAATVGRDPYAPISRASRSPVPAVIAAAVDRSLILAPERRWATIEEFRAALGWSGKDLAPASAPAGARVGRREPPPLQDARSGPPLPAMPQAAWDVPVRQSSPDATPVASTSLPLLHRSQAHQGKVSAVAIEPKAKFALSTGEDGTLKLVHLPTLDAKTLSAPLSRAGALLAFAPDGRLALSIAGNGEVLIWDVAAGQTVQTVRGQRDRTLAAAFSPDSRFVLTGVDTLAMQLWDVSSGLRTAVFPPSHATSEVVRAMAISPEGSYVAYGGADGKLSLAEIPTGRLIATTVAHRNWINAVSFAPNGRYVISASDDKTLFAWHLSEPSASRALAGHKSIVRAAVFSPDSRLVASVGDDFTLRLWDLASGREIRQPMQHGARVTAVAYSPDGTGILTGTSDGFVYLWDARQL